MKRSVKTLLTLLCLVLLLVFLYSGYRLLSALAEYRSAERAYHELAEQYVTSNGQPEASRGSETKNGDDPGALGLTEVSPISVDFAALQGECKDIIAWLYSEDTVINYPVVDGIDNDYYLRRMIDGSYSTGGTLFTDFRCPTDFSGQNTVIYGHRMHDGSKFASLAKYSDQSYYEQHPSLYLNTPGGNYRIDLFSGFVTPADSTVYTFSFASEADFAAWIEKITGFSDFNCEVEVGPSDRIVTLSTCTYDYENARYVAIGKLVPIG